MYKYHILKGTLHLIWCFLYIYIKQEKQNFGVDPIFICIRFDLRNTIFVTKVLLWETIFFSSVFWFFLLLSSNFAFITLIGA